MTLDVRSNANFPAFLVAGTHSGVGKTTVTLALIRAILRGGRSVQPFKLGPDFIDTAYHSEAAERDSINLDVWMMGADKVKSAFTSYAETANVAIIEAMGALFDGENGTERGSAAYLAKLLQIPVILVVDIWGMTRSTVPLLEGFFSFDRALTFAGFIMNRAGSIRHVQMIEAALPENLRKQCLGYVIRDKALEIPERHLGLVTVQENAIQVSERRAALEKAASGIDVDRFVPASHAPIRPLRSVGARGSNVRVGIARDAAFCFYYAENLRMLEEAGAQLCPFSPIEDGELPKGISGLYIGGGYPESFLHQLGANEAIKQRIRALASAGMPVYAECGGFMYLGQTLAGADHQTARMVGMFAIDTIMDPAHLAIRYVSVRTLLDSPLGPAGTVARGQEFHQSRIAAQGDGAPIYEVTSSTGEHHQEGLSRGATVGSYIHLHFASNPDVPRHFIKSCATWLQAGCSAQH